MLANMTRIGVFGGTFDPIHLGHMVHAEMALSEFGLDSVVFVPAGHPPHKSERIVTDAEDRYTMTCLAVQDNPRFLVSRMELDRTGPSFTVDTLEAFAVNYPSAKLFFIAGTDALSELFTWKDWPRLLSLCDFIVADRPGSAIEGFYEELPIYCRHLSVDVNPVIHRLHSPMIEISSTALRSRIRDAKSVRYLIPHSVMHFIQSRGLYDSHRAYDVSPVSFE